MRAFSRKSSYVIIILMIAALILTGTVPSFAANSQETYTTSEGTVYPLEKAVLLDGIPEVKGESAILIDGGSARILYEKNAEKLKDPASLTKIITCLLTLENKDLDEEITIDFSPSMEGNNIALKKGERIKIKDLLYALMLYSSNDAAEVLAVEIGGDVATFAEMMNERAKECGAQNTTFNNPNGLNPDGQDHNWTTAYDVSLMAREALKNSTFRKLVTTMKYTIPATNLSKSRKLKATNPCLGVYEGITGVKTGTSKSAGFCFCGSAKRNGTELIAVSLDSGEKQRFTDVTKLMDYGFANYHSYTVQRGAEALDEIRVRRGNLHSVEVGLAEDLKLTLAKSDKGEGITTELKFTKKKLTAPVKKGIQVGTLVAYDEDHNQLAEARLITVESADKGGVLSYIGIADEDRVAFFIGLLIAAVLLVLIAIVLQRMKEKQRARRRASRRRKIKRREREREKDPFNRNV